MRIALDYDQTVSAAPDFWRDFIALAHRQGHEVRIVTARDDRRDRTAPLVELEGWCPVIYCRGSAKRWYCSHFTNFAPDVWIDDKPESVFENSATSPEKLQEWRATRNEGPTL